MSSAEPKRRSSRQPDGIRLLVIGGVVSCLLYFVLFRLSFQFAWGTIATERPLIEVLGLFAALCGLYWWSVRQIFRAGEGRWSLPLVILFSIAFRLLTLFGEPIQEVDAYRYLWDGKVASMGIDPFRFSPQQVLEADGHTGQPEDLNRLVDLRDQSSSNHTILSRVHFGELTTVYPPVSQLVFAAVAFVTPDHAAVTTQMIIVKAGIVLFDLGTLALVIGLLRYTGRPAEWSIVYGWCPLVIKEFANSGHLDSIAVCLTTAALFCALKALFPAGQFNDVQKAGDRDINHRGTRWLWLCSLTISAAVGAKIYPVVLFPLLFCATWRVFSLARAVGVAGITLFLCGAMIIPMLSRDESVRANAVVELHKDTVMSPEDPPLPDVLGRIADVGETVPLNVDRKESATGLAAFSSRWQMNDFLFLLLFENLRPNAAKKTEFAPPVEEQRPGDRFEAIELPPRPPIDVESVELPAIEFQLDAPKKHRSAAWFVVTTNHWRNWIVEAVSNRTGVASESVPFLLSRLVTSGIFVVIAMWLAVRSSSHHSAEQWLRAGFLTIAWFWMLQPTQNPWYWIWAMPLLPFARSRSWLAVSGFVLVYYLRFWLSYHYSDTTVGVTSYYGKDFFDLCVTWIEFGPLLIWLLISRWRRSWFRIESP